MQGTLAERTPECGVLGWHRVPQVLVSFTPPAPIWSGIGSGYLGSLTLLFLVRLAAARTV